MEIAHSLARLAGRLLRPSPPAEIRLETPSFKHGATLPEPFAGRNGRSPVLRWSRVPPDTRELVLLLEDPDAPSARPFVHWVVYGIPPTVNELDEGLPPTHIPLANGLQQGRNSLGSDGYVGPMPPPGHGVHHYHFQLFALDQSLDVEAPVDRDQLVEAMRDHVIASGEIVGTYENP